MLSVTKIVVTLEGGVGTQTVPLLITEMGFKAEVRDWSSQVQKYSQRNVFHVEVGSTLAYQKN